MPVTFEPADNLRSRTFLGLLLAQFLAAFNDQAIHASAMFFAINRGILNEAQAISLMPILFYAPWALFCTLAGYLADRFSKQRSLIFWKIAEVAITLLALAGFWFGSGPNGLAFGPWLVLSSVFLMGMHSAFFVPAKYGAMPEILTGRMLSRGNGVLESLSFLAVILGTVFGGVLSTEFRGHEEIIGLILVSLAVVGALASLLIQPIPAANPQRRFPPYLFGPLYDNIRAMVRSRPLSFALIGIAFFTFMVAFMRSTVYMFGESQVPPWTESQTSILVGMVALGIGIGSPLVGYLSGGKVEVGLVPIGALGMMLATVAAAFVLGHTLALVGCIILIGFFTGFYLVPLFTLLQHRAPKTSKGDTIATSNFINVVGAILASGMFFLVNFAATRSGLVPEIPQEEERPRTLLRDPVFRDGRPYLVVLGKKSHRQIGGEPDESEPGERQIILVGSGNLIEVFKDPLKEGDRVIESTHKIGNVNYHTLRRENEPLQPAYDKRPLPTYLFLGAGLLTLVTLVLLRLRLPDLFLRTRLWFRWLGHARIEATGVNHLPESGAAILATDCSTTEASLQVLSATDRTIRFLMVQSPEEASPDALVRTLALSRGLGLVSPSAKEPVDWAGIRSAAERMLDRGEVIALPLVDMPQASGVDQFLDHLITSVAPTILPVHCASARGGHVVYIIVGRPLPCGTSAAEVRQALHDLAHQHLPGSPPEPSHTSLAADLPTRSPNEIPSPPSR
jgi:MFS family permease